MKPTADGLHPRRNTGLVKTGANAGTNTGQAQCSLIQRKSPRRGKLLSLIQRKISRRQKASGNRLRHQKQKQNQQLPGELLKLQQKKPKK
eukprot:symbB.v1.2.016530.t2/scaffold1257.1/size128495/9